MYKKIVTPRKVTQEWLDQAFAPLRHHLEKNDPDHAECIIGYHMFIGNEDERFHYKHSITRSYIVFDQAGELVSCPEDALEHQFDWLSEGREVRRKMEDRFIHPNVNEWIDKNLDNKAAETYGDEIRILLQELWGPIVNFDFSDIQTGYPLNKKNLPYSLYLYPTSEPSRIAFQILSDAIWDGRCSAKVRRDYTIREVNLCFEGWKVLSFVRDNLEFDMPIMTQRVIKMLNGQSFPWVGSD
jgi:hypothetical protein